MAIKVEKDSSEREWYVLENSVPENMRKVDSIKAYIHIVENREPVKAFVKLIIGVIEIRGVTVKLKDFKKDGSVPKLCFDMPGYPSGGGYAKSAIIEDKRLYLKVANKVADFVKKHFKEVEGVGNDKKEKVNPDDIPI